MSNRRHWTGHRIGIAAGLVLSAVLSAPAQVPVPPTGCYHAAFAPNDPAHGVYGRAEFVRLSGKSLAIEMFYTGWPTNKVPDFPSATCDTIVKYGSIPHITWEPWTGSSSDALSAILSGSWDAYLIGYAQQTKQWGKPLFIRVGHEMNGNWYPWCGALNGGATLTGFGDPAKADGPERFIAAFRHIRHIFDSVGVTNVSWIWAPNNFSTPADAWNAPEAYYPGDDVVDWIGFDGYNWGTSQTWSGWASFYNTFQDIYNRFASSTKPFMIAEFASAEVGGDKGQWIREAFLYTKGLFTKIKALTWFNINKETDWRINSGTATLTGYAQAVSDSYFLGAVPTTAVASAVQAPAVETVFLPPSPNPTNGAVTCTISIPAAVTGSLRIYNLLGQEVRLLAQGAWERGIHRWTWDTRDAANGAVPSGVYLAVCLAGRQRFVQKILITK